MQLKDSETEKNLKFAFARSSSVYLGYLYFAGKADLEDTMMPQRCFGPQPRAKRDMRRVISITSSR